MAERFTYDITNDLRLAAVDRERTRGPVRGLMREAADKLDGLIEDLAIAENARDRARDVADERSRLLATAQREADLWWRRSEKQVDVIADRDLRIEQLSAALAGAEQATTDARREPPAQPLWVFFERGDLLINQAHPAIAPLRQLLIEIDGDDVYANDVFYRWQAALAANLPTAADDPYDSGLCVCGGGPNVRDCGHGSRRCDDCECDCVGALAADVPAAADHEHPGGYLSTACLHGLCEPECGAAQRARGYIGHPTCKYCQAKCTHSCHTGGQVERAERVHADGCTLAADDPHHSGWCALPDGSPARPTVVVLCGSGRFGQAFREANATETLAGRIVLSIGVTKADLEPLDADRRRQVEDALDDLHKRKIDLADEVFVLNVGGYIGSSTRSEIEYAQAHGKPIRWLEPVPAAGEAEVTPRIVERDLCWKPVIAEDGYAENCGLWEGHVPPCLLVCGDCREGRCHIPVRPPAPGVGDPDCGCARHNSSIAAWRLGEDDGAAAGSGEPTKAGGQP